MAMMSISRRAFVLAGAAVFLAAMALIATPVQATPGIAAWWGNIGIGPSTGSGLFGNEVRGVAVNDTTGEVYVADAGNNRLQRFDPSQGADPEEWFVSAWGRDVDGTGAGTGYEVCLAAVGSEVDHCKAATASTGLGGEFSKPQGVAVNQVTEHVYVTDSSNRRVQEFSASGAFIRAFGQDVVSSGSEQADEQQTLTVDATGGQYKLTFGADTTVDLAWNAAAAEVETALNALSSVNGGGGSVTVAGGPGGLGGTTPYLIGFGGARADTNLAAITASSGTLPLSGGGAAATITTFNDGAVGFEICDSAANCKAGSSTGTSGGTFNATIGYLTVAPVGSPNAGHVLVADAGNRRVQEFTATGAFVRAFGWDVVAAGPDNQNFASGPGQANELQSVRIRAASGEFRLKFGAGGPGISETANLPFNSSAAAVQGALNAIANISTGGGSVTVSGGPGDAAAASPYLITFDGGPLAGKNVAEVTAPSVGLAGGVPTTNTTVLTLLPGNAGFEVCNATAFDVCQAGAAGVGKGGFAQATPTRIAEDKFGRIYTVEPAISFRVQRFTLPGNVVTSQGEFAAGVLHGSQNHGDFGAFDVTTQVAVNGAGDVYVVKAFPRGSGIPPVVASSVGSTTKWQERVLKVGPVSEEVLEVMAANPGHSNDVNSVVFENIEGLAVQSSGVPIYASNSSFAEAVRNRVYRIDEIAGPDVTVEPAGDVGASTVTLRATVKPAVIPLDTFYRFEYSSDGVSWTRAPIPDANLGNGSAGGESSTCPVPRASTCHVSQEVTGLTPNVTYQVRLRAFTDFNGAIVTESGEEFTTKPATPVTVTGVAHWSSPAATNPSLTLGGTINPGNDRTTYYFEYVDEASFQVDGFQQATRIPSAPAEAGRGLRNVAVRQVVGGLHPSATYRYRLVASNSVDAKVGAVRSVGPPSDDDRFYEQVSAGDSWGSGIELSVASVSGSGNRAMFKAQAFGQPPSLPGLATPFVSERGSEGWKVAMMLPDPDRAIRGIVSIASVSSDLGKMLWTETSIGERERSEAQFGFANFDGSLTAASQQLVPLSRSGHGLYTVKGASTDLGKIVFSFGGSGSVTLAPEEILPGNGRSNLYEVSGAGGPSPTLSIVNRADGTAGAIIGGVCGAWLGNEGQGVGIVAHSVSADGGIAYFNTDPGAPTTGKCETLGPRRLFKRINNETTVEVSAPQCSPTPTCPGSPAGSDEYQGASADGSVVFFKTPRRLTNSDTDATSDLYLYDETPPAGEPKLVQVSAGVVAPGHPTVGSGAKVLGVLDNANDGSRVYFVAEGALSGANLQGKAPAAGAKNLYVYERDDAQASGRIGFVGGLAPGDEAGDEKEWITGEDGGKKARALPVKGQAGDGHGLVLVSAAKLLGADTDSAKDVYLYDDSAGEAAKALRCLSCGGTGAFEARVTTRPTNDFSSPNYEQQAPVASEDLSTAVFTSQEGLLTGDENGTWDVYVWQGLGVDACTESISTPTFAYLVGAGGCLSLISAATEGFGVEKWSAAISADGENVFFVTSASLVGSDTNNALDLYDARIGGGFPEQVPVEACEGESSCHGAPVPLSPPVSSGSGSFSGPGNRAAPKSCPKGKVRKGGKCVKKPSRHKEKPDGKKQHKKRTHNDRGGNR
jgi:tripartite motif-containing protein 71